MTVTDQTTAASTIDADDEIAAKSPHPLHCC